MAGTPYDRRVRRLLLDEDYGPALARLNRADTAHVLELVRENKPREARQEIIRLDLERRSQVTQTRIRRRNDRIVDHFVAVLVEDGVHNYSVQTITFGVSIMTRGEGDGTLLMDGAEIRARAGAPDFIQFYEPLGIEVNKWWYH